MEIWIVNPFDELPGDTDIRHRYWSLAETLGGMGHQVTWWTSDFSHRHKRHRHPRLSASGRPVTDDGELPFRLRLLPTRPYHRNISFARAASHRRFAKTVHAAATEALRLGTTPPDRLVVSLPPLETAAQAFRIRNACGCEVVVDIMDAWPWALLRLIPLREPARNWIGRVALAPSFSAFRKAIAGADRVSAVARSYLDLASNGKYPSEKRFHLCFHGIDLPSDRGPAALPSIAPVISGGVPLRLAYVGSLERTYDLETCVEAVAELNRNGQETQLLVAGRGSRERHIRSVAEACGLKVDTCPSEEIARSLHPVSGEYAAGGRVIFWEFLGHEDLETLLANAHFGLVPMAADSGVALPYKLADYCAAGLPVLSSLDGECRELIGAEKVGSHYAPASASSLLDELKPYLEDPAVYDAAAHSSRRLAMRLFDRRSTYPVWADFILGSR